MALELKYPFMLILLLPAFFLMYLYFRKIRLKRTREKIVIGGLRSVLFVLLIFALAIPHILLPIKQESILFLVDRSASFEAAEEGVLDWLDESLKAKKKEQAFSIVSFADGAAVEQSLSDKKTTAAPFNGKLKTGETNLEEGIGLAASLIKPEQGGRIVLLTDGNETAGSSIEAAKLLKNQKIELDYVHLKQEFRADMAVTKLDVLPSLYEGEQANLSVTIDSNVEKAADLRISLNHREILHKKIHVKQGRNEFSFAHITAEPGVSVYKVEIAAEGDTFIENNTLHAVSTVKGTPKVLIVQGDQEDGLAQILTSSGLKVEKQIPEKLPTTMAGMLQYQSIIFNNVPGTKITEQQMVLLEKAVKEFGRGFVMLGGEESFGLGGYFKTPIEKLLPVNMDIKGKKQMPSLGLVIVIDRSGSMSGGKLTLAKEAAARSVELLRDEDTLGFIAFDDRPWVIVETAPLKNKKKAIEKIRSVSVGGGTNIYPSLAMAYQQLTDLKLQRKHIILLTDGQSAADGDYESLIADGKKHNITLSTVALGTDADRNLLEDLAGQGSGRFYEVTDASVIPSILSRETVMTTRTYIEDHPFYPAVQPYPEWTSLFQQGIPKMNAYIAVTAKNRADVPLRSEKKDPILAQWQYGLGTTLAFTSDMTGKWSGDWAKWKNWGPFLNQMVTKSLPKYESEPFSFTLDKEADNTVVHVKTEASQFLPTEVSIVSQNGTVIDTNSKPTAPGELEVLFPYKPGMYFLRMKQATETGADKVFQTGFSVPYSSEYLLKPTNKELLKKLAAVSGGKELTTPKEAFRPLKQQARKSTPITEPLLIAAFLLLLLEIFIRRLGVQLFLVPLKLLRKERKERKGNEQGQTKVFEQLSKVKTRSEQERTIVQKKVSNPARTNKTAPQKPSQSKLRTKSAPTASPEEKADRMKRLLEAKKRKR